VPTSQRTSRVTWRAWWRHFFGWPSTRVGERFDMADKIEAIILPVSRTEQPSWIIHHLQPERVTLLFSDESRELAHQIEREHANGVIFDPSVAELEARGDRLADAHDLADGKSLTARFIRRFHEELRVPRHRIFVDTTGGTKPMSLGAFQAAEEAGVSSIYVLGCAEGRLILDPTDRSQGDPRFMSDQSSPASKR
jgi:hypothetical protein